MQNPIRITTVPLDSPHKIKKLVSILSDWYGAGAGEGFQSLVRFARLFRLTRTFLEQPDIC